MTGLIGSLNLYLRKNWSLTTPLGTYNIHWASEDGAGWFNPTFPYTPQISINDLVAPIRQRFNNAGTLTETATPTYTVNCWVQIPVGSSGTAEASWVEQMRLETVKILRSGFVNGYGGSLPFGVVLPMDQGFPRHEMDRTPKTLRYEITVLTTLNNEG